MFCNPTTSTSVWCKPYIAWKERKRATSVVAAEAAAKAKKEEKITLPKKNRRQSIRYTQLIQIQAVLATRLTRLERLATGVFKKWEDYCAAIKLAESLQNTSQNKQEIYKAEQIVYKRRQLLLSFFEYDAWIEIESIQQAFLLFRASSHDVTTFIATIARKWQTIEEKTMFWSVDDDIQQSIKQCYHLFYDLWQKLHEQTQALQFQLELEIENEKCVNEQQARQRRGKKRCASSQEEEEQEKVNDDKEQSQKRRRKDSSCDLSTPQAAVVTEAKQIQFHQQPFSNSLSALLSNFEQQVLIDSVALSTKKHSRLHILPPSSTSAMLSNTIPSMPSSNTILSSTIPSTPSNTSTDRKRTQQQCFGRYVEEDLTDYCPSCHYPLTLNERLGNFICSNPNMPHVFPVMTNVANAIAFNDMNTTSTGGSGGHGGGMILKNVMNGKDTASETIANTSSMVASAMFAFASAASMYDSFSSLSASLSRRIGATQNEAGVAAPTAGTSISSSSSSSKKIGNPIVKKAHSQNSHSQFCSRLRDYFNLPCVKRRNSRKRVIPPNLLKQLYDAVEQACKTNVIRSFDDLTVAHVDLFFKQLTSTKTKMNVRKTELYTALTGKPAPYVTTAELELILRVRELFDLKTRAILKTEAAQISRKKRRWRNLESSVDCSSQPVQASPRKTDEKSIMKFNWMLQAVAVTSFLGMNHLTRHLPQLGEKLRSRHAAICRQVLEEIRTELHLVNKS